MIGERNDSQRAESTPNSRPNPQVISPRRDQTFPKVGGLCVPARRSFVHKRIRAENGRGPLRSHPGTLQRSLCRQSEQLGPLSSTRLETLAPRASSQDPPTSSNEPSIGSWPGLLGTPGPPVEDLRQVRGTATPAAHLPVAEPWTQCLKANRTDCPISLPSGCLANPASTSSGPGLRSPETPRSGPFFRGDARASFPDVVLALRSSAGKTQRRRLAPPSACKNPSRRQLIPKQPVRLQPDHWERCASTACRQAH